MSRNLVGRREGVRTIASMVRKKEREREREGELRKEKREKKRGGVEGDILQWKKEGRDR